MHCLRPLTMLLDAISKNNEIKMPVNATYIPVKLVVVTFENGTQKVSEFISGEDMIKYAEMMKKQSVKVDMYIAQKMVINK